jgi:hypothetical protein
MRHDLLFETNRFNLSETKDHFINPCCFGEDVAAWLRGELIKRNIEVIEPDQEDWGWYIEAKHEGRSYFVGVGGNADESSTDSNQGEWRIMVEKHRSIWEKLTRKNEMSEADEMVTVIWEILGRQTDFKNLHHETGA